MYKVIVTGTDPESGMGGIGFALPGFFFAMRRVGIEYEFIPTHHAAEWGGKWLWLLRAIPKIYRSIKAGKNAEKDIIVYSHAGAIPSMLRGGCVLALARLLGAKAVMQLHSVTVDSDLNSFWKRRLFSIATAPATAISVLTPWWYNRLVDSGIQKHVFVIPNVLPEGLEKKAAVRISHSFGQKKLVVLALSHVEPGKGVDLLIEAMPALPDHVHLIVAGDGSQLSAMKSRVDVLGLNSRVKFTGWVSGGGKQQLLDEANIYCLPTSYDSFGMGFLEAMANGLPVVALDWGPIGDVVKHECCGLLIDDKSHKLLSGAIERLLDNDLRQHMGEHAQKWVVDEFGSKRVGGLLRKMFEKVIMRTVE